MHLICLHGLILRNIGGGGERGGSNELLLDGNNYQDSNYTEWKLVMSNVSILNFMTIPTPVIF